MERVWLSIFLLLVLICGMGVSAAGEENYQLVNYNWNKVLENADDPLIIYNFSFKELSSEGYSLMEGKVSLTDNISGVYWKLIRDEELLKLAGEDKVEFSVEIFNKNNNKVNSSSANSRLITVGYQPISVSLSEDKINFYEDIVENVLKLDLKPLKIADKQVLTNFSLTTRDGSGNIANSELTTWIKASGERPLAVISKSIKNKRKVKNKYYAMYLTAAVLAPGEICYSSIAPVGDLTGLNKLFKTSSAEYPVEKKASIYLKEKGVWLRYSSDRPTGKLSASLSIDEQSREYLTYQLGFDLPLFKREELDLSAQINNYYLEDDSIFFLGLSDCVNWSSKLDIKLGYYPLVYDFEQGKITKDDYKYLLLRWDLKKWVLWYQLAHFKDLDRDKLGFEYKLNDQLLLETIWQDAARGQGQELFLGLSWLIE